VQPLGEIRRHRIRFVADLALGVAPHLVATPAQIEVARVVVLEGDAAAVVSPAVRLDGEPPVGPGKSTVQRPILTLTSGFGSPCRRQRRRKPRSRSLRVRSLSTSSIRIPISSACLIALRMSRGETARRRSAIVRETLVTGMPLRTVTSSAWRICPPLVHKSATPPISSEGQRCTRMPRRLPRPPSPGTETSTGPSVDRSSPHSAAAGPWLSTARSPYATTAAIH
jgi:hypothetical protein